MILFMLKKAQKMIFVRFEIDALGSMLACLHRVFRGI